jgi:hypothetical protein
VAKPPSAAFDASLPDSCADAITEIGVSLLIEGDGGNPPSNLLKYTNPLVATVPEFLRLAISVFVNARFQMPTSSILPINKSSSTKRESEPSLRG